MKVIGLTGSIGSGKTTVAAHLRQLGATVIDADEGVRSVQAPGEEGLRQLVAEFGDEILSPSGELDRAKLARLVFADAPARKRLNAIIHPLVRAWMAERLGEADARGEAVVVLDIPLLYETRGDAGLDAVILVYAPEDLMLRRLTELRGMTEADARARVAAQLPMEEKRRRATHVIENTGTLSDLRARTEEVWRELARGTSSRPDGC